MAGGDFVMAPDGVRLFFRLEGQGNESLIVPGIGAEMDFGRLGANRRVAFYDIRNRGRSDAVTAPVRVGVPVETDDIEAVRAQVAFERTSVVGWSYVGLVAALYAAGYPQFVERLVMVCPAAPCKSLQPESGVADAVLLQRLSELATTGLASTDPVAYAREWRRIVTPTQMGDPTAFELLAADPSIWPNEWPEHKTEALERVFAAHPVDFDYRPDARLIAAPTLVIHGDVDSIPFAASEAWTRAIPDARLLVLRNVGHFPHVEAPSAFFDAVETFLNGDWPDGSKPVTA